MNARTPETKKPELHSAADQAAFEGLLGAPGSNVKDVPSLTGATVNIGGTGFNNNVYFSAKVGELVKNVAAMPPEEIARLKTERQMQLSQALGLPASGTGLTDTTPRAAPNWKSVGLDAKSQAPTPLKT